MPVENWRSKDAVQIVAKELFKVLIDLNVYSVSQQAIAQKIFKLVNEFKGIEHYSTVDPKKEVHFRKESKILLKLLTSYVMFLTNISNKERRWKTITNYACMKLTGIFNII